MKYLIDRHFGTLKQERSQLTRDRIISAAYSLCEDGSKLTIEKVAERANCSVPTLRRHFKGKNPLYHAVLIHGASEFLDSLENEFASFETHPTYSSCRSIVELALKAFPVDIETRRQFISSISSADILEILSAFNKCIEQVVREGIAKAYNLYPSSLDPDRLFILSRLMTTVIKFGLLEQDENIRGAQFIDSLSKIFYGMIEEHNPH